MYLSYSVLLSVVCHVLLLHPVKLIKFYKEIEDFCEFKDVGRVGPVQIEKSLVRILHWPYVKFSGHKK